MHNAKLLHPPRSEVKGSGGAAISDAFQMPSYWYARCEDGTYVVGRSDEEIAWGLAGETARQVVEALTNSTQNRLNPPKESNTP